MSIVNLNNNIKRNAAISVDQSTIEALLLIAEQFPGRALFQTAFTPEDQVLTHLIFEHNIPIRVFTRTGTDYFDILRQTIDLYGKSVEISFRQAELASATFAENNEAQLEHWDANPEIAPLHYLLGGKHILLSSERKERAANDPLQWDATNEKYIFCPLTYWTDKQIYAFILENTIPHLSNSIPVSLQSDTAGLSVQGWSGSFRKYLPQYSLVSGTFNIAGQVATFFRLPQLGNELHVASSN